MNSTTSSAAVPEGTIKRTLCGVPCACCGVDIKPGAYRVTTIDGVHCSKDCAATDATRAQAVAS